MLGDARVIGVVF